MGGYRLRAAWGSEVQGRKLAVELLCGFVVGLSGLDFVLETAEGKAFAVDGDLCPPFV